MPERIPQSTAKLVVFRAISSADHFTPATSKTIAITISKNGAVGFSNPNAGATNATEMASGFYKFTLDTTDTGTKGPLAWRGAGTGIDDVGDVFEVVNATNAGFTALPDVASGSAGAAITSGTGTAQLSVSSGRALADLDTIKTQTVTCAAGVTVLASVGTAATSTAQTGDAFARLGAPAGASVSADVAAVKSDTAAILDDTGTSGVVVAAGSKTGYALTAAYDFAKGTTAMTEAYAANGAAPTPVQAIFAIHQYLMQFGISTTNYTVKKLDNTTTAFVVTLDDATTPSAAART